MKLLVTGGAGFIGSNFILYWMKNNPGDEIVNLDKLTYAGNLENLKEVENNKNYKFVKGDICDFDFVKPLVKDCDIVVHFAAESHVDRSISGPNEFIQTNIVGTQSLLEAAQFVETIERCQGYKIACLEEIAFNQGWLRTEDIVRLAKPLAKNGYGQYLMDLVKE